MWPTPDGHHRRRYGAAGLDFALTRVRVRIVGHRLSWTPTSSTPIPSTTDPTRHQQRAARWAPEAIGHGSEWFRRRGIS
jgi:hypothetical protein